MTCLWGEDFHSVKEGEWVIFEDGEGDFKVSRNMRNAMQALQVDVGSAITIKC